MKFVQVFIQSTSMKISVLFFFTLPFISFAQEGVTTLEIQMFNFDKVVVCIDGEEFNKCSKFKLTNIASGEHLLKIFKPKTYTNPYNQKVSERLIPIFSGTIFLLKKQITNCTINEFHEKKIKITTT